MLLRWTAPMLMTVALSGCGAVGAIGLHPFAKKGPETAVAEVTPAPAGKIESNELPPAGGAGPATTGSTASSSGGLAMTDSTTGTPPSANGAPLGAGVEVSRTDLLGGWTLTNGTESCQLFMTLTSWTGGYRASTRGCTSEALKTISAWNVDGKQVVLAGAGGAPVAQLVASAQGRFEGQLASGSTISFYR